MSIGAATRTWIIVFGIIEFMAQITLLKFVFRANKKQLWFEWCDELRARSDEVLVTLRQEGVHIEAFFISERENACYYLMEADDLVRVQEMYENSGRLIDIQHKQKMDESYSLLRD